ARRIFADSHIQRSRGEIHREGREVSMANPNDSLARAEARYVHVSAQKARLVVDMIRGRQAGDAINILNAVNELIAPAVEKVLRSAIANAENKSEDVDVDKLFVTE